MPWLRQLLAGFTPRKAGFNPRSVHVRFVVHKVALWQGSLPVLQSSPVRNFPPMLDTHLHLRGTKPSNLQVMSLSKWGAFDRVSQFVAT